MIRALTLSCGFIGAAACMAPIEPLAHESSLCDAGMPGWSLFDSQTFPLSGVTSIYICTSPTAADHVWAFPVGDDQVKARVDIAPQQRALFFQKVFGLSAGVSAVAPRERAVRPLVEPLTAMTIQSIVCKGTTGMAPMATSGAQASDAVGEVDPDNAAYFIYRTQAVQAAGALADAEFASGKVCPKKAL